jgi:hypothetical protein
MGFMGSIEGLCYVRRGSRDFWSPGVRRRHGRGSPGSMRLERRPEVLNRFERSSPMAGEAELRYLDGDFRVVRPGAFVRCAVTGTPIPLEELKYWSVDLQEAYSSPEAVLQRHPARSAGS